MNYDRLANEYAQHRQVHPEALRMLLTQGALDASAKVLEVSCGTGNYSRAIAEAVGCACWGIDPSAQMLAHARSKSNQVIFQLGSAEQLDFPAALFDLIFSVDVIHHVGNRFAYFQAAQRVLRAGGKFCTVTDSETMIRQRQPLSVYFPATIEVELARYPRLSDLHAYLDQLGFVDVQTLDVEFAYTETSLERYRAKAYSCLHLIAEEEFQQGIMRMEQALRQGPLPSVARYTLLWATKAADMP